MKRPPTAMVVNCATLGPIGRRLPAPGTWGSAAGLLYYGAVFIAARPGPVGTLVLNLLGLGLAVALCGEAERRLGRKDPGEIILDEFVAMPLCYLGWPRLVGPLPPWGVLLAGFVLFRCFDIAKPLGIRKLQAWPGGWGVVGDDAAAALATCAMLHAGAALWRHNWPW